MIADPQLSISKPESIRAASLRMIAFTTKVNSPKVTIFTGRVRINNIGRKIAFKNPITTAASIALPNPDILNPGTK